MKLGRRKALTLAIGAGTGLVLLKYGRNYYAAERGDAFAPWNFPNAETRSEFVAARAALLAANPHNTQPWAMRVSATRIDLYADFARHLGTMDSLLREMHVGLGCALENLVVAARSSGRKPDVRLVPDPMDHSLVASVSLEPVNPSADPLLGVIARRHTNRGRYADAPLASDDEAGLQGLITELGVQLHVLSGSEGKNRFRQATIDATRAIIGDREMSRDSNDWYRQTAAEIETHRDGITIDATGNGPWTRAFGKVLGRPREETMNRYWLDGTSGDQTTGSAFCVLSTPLTNSREDQLRAGRVYQRAHLWAAHRGLAMQPLNQMAERQDREETRGLAPEFTAVLRDLMGVPDRRAQMLFRIGYPRDTALASPRRPLEWVLKGG
jgi:hypothetical protein